MTMALDALIAATPVKHKDPHMQATAIVALQEALAAPQPDIQAICKAYERGVSTSAGNVQNPYPAGPSAEAWALGRAEGQRNTKL